MKFAAALFFVAATAFAQRTITVSGTGRVAIAPDHGQFVVGVTTRAGSVGEAMRENSDKTQRVIAALKAKGVAAAEIQTTNFSLQQPWENGRRLVGQYDVRNVVTVTRGGTGSMSELLQAAIDAGANEVMNVRFFAADSNAARDQATAAAYADARRRAEKLAVAAGKTVAEPLMITTEQLPNPARPLVGGVQGGVEAPGATPPLESGMQTVTATVIVTFELK
jgi:uncharacterized protein YggE